MLANSRVLISNMKIFKTTGKKFPNKAYLVPNLKVFFILDETLHFEKFEGAGVKHDHNFFKFQVKIPHQGIVRVGA